jgi:Zn-dependent protease with chaperone function
MTNHIVVASHDQRKRRLAWLFAVTMLAFIAAVDGLLLWVGGDFKDVASPGNVKFVVVLAACIGGCALFQLQRLAGDGAEVAALLGGRCVVLEPSTPALRQFRNVATETAIAAGIPMPKLFVLESDSRINAFAAGTATQGSAICVSAGALQQLNRAELQGVIAHEMAHLKHDDVALSRLLAAGIFALLCFTLLGKVLIFLAASGGRSRSKEGSGAALVALGVGMAMVVTGFVGWTAAAILDAATSREMEFRADAEAVRMLSDSSGLVGALVKLGQEAGDIPGEVSGLMRASNPMFFNAAVKRYWFDTHPPLMARIRALDPARAAELTTEMGG